MCSENVTYDPIALIFDKCVSCKRVASAAYDPLAPTFLANVCNARRSQVPLTTLLH